MFRRREPVQVDEPTWGRGKLIAVLVFAVTVALALVAGLVVAVSTSLHPAGPPAAAGKPTGHAGTAAGTVPAGFGIGLSAADQAKADALADTAMRTVDPLAARPGPVSARDPGVIVLPKPTTAGPAGVPAGFPHTPQGALAQLAALDKTAMESGSLDGVRRVIASWAAPGGPTPQSWSGVKAMAVFLNAAGLSGGGSPELAMVVTPLMGLLKGSVGPDFVVACVNFQFDATLNSTRRVAVADCQRMVWQGGRWVIGPGREPAPAPSVWADTDLAIDVGYKDLRHA